MKDYMKIVLVGFYTFLNNAIVRTSFQLNGEDSLYYDGELYKITANYNAGEACIYGMSLGLNLDMSDHFNFYGTFNYTKGLNLSDDVPLGHIPPLFGRASLTYGKNRIFAETWLRYQGWKHIVDFSPYGEDNKGEATEEGFPSWWTANIKVGFSTFQYLDIMLAVENLFDRFYKPYASGVSAPGINFVATARFTL